MTETGRNESNRVDVCFLLEGTYPYIRGGVSSWVHQMLTEAPGLTFAIFFIGSQREEATEFAYELPANVRAVEEVFLYDPFPPRRTRPLSTSGKYSRGSFRNAGAHLS